MLSIQMYLVPNRLVVRIASLKVFGMTSMETPERRLAEVFLFSWMNWDFPEQWLNVTYGPLIDSSAV